MSAIPASEASLDSLLRDPRIWRGAALDRDIPATASGHAALDALLPHHGWTIGTLTEVLFDIDGIGELDLLLPALAGLTRQRKHIVVVAAPYLLYPAALLAYGVALDYVHCVDTASEVEALWVSEQALRSGICAAVLCWPRQATDRSLRRLQVAAESGNALGFAFRASRAAANPSPAATRIQLQTTDETRLRILKCRGANPPAQSIRLRVSRSSVIPPLHALTDTQPKSAPALVNAAHRFAAASAFMENRHRHL